MNSSALAFGFQPEARRALRAVRACYAALGWSWEVTYNVATKEEALVFVYGTHGWFGCAVYGLLHGGETCRVRVAERRRAPRTPSCHFAVCLRHACSTPSAVTLNPSAVEGHEHRRCHGGICPGTADGLSLLN